MNPFSDSRSNSKLSLLGQFAAQPALIAFVLCLALGLMAVVWRSRSHANAAGDRARADAVAQQRAIELQFNQVLTAAEVLGALARQSGGPIPNFQKVASDLLAAHPGLASLELQPGGVVSDIVPRAENNRALGFNVLTDPAARPGAALALQNRALTVSGPLKLYRGDPGLVARVPIFARGRDGRDSFWGFVAVSMRLSDVLTRAGYELARRDYDYVFFAPPSRQQKAVILASRGTVSPSGPVQQLIRVQNLELGLSLEPRGGWVSTTKIVLECFAVLLASALLCLLVNLLEHRRAVEIALADASDRLARETAERKQALADSRAAQDRAAAAQAELQQTQAAREQTESLLAESQARLETTLRSAHQAAESAEARIRQAQTGARELQDRLDATVCAADETVRASQAELEQARAALQQAQQKAGDLQARLDTAARAAKKTADVHAAKLEQLEETIRQLETRLRAVQETPVTAPEPASAPPEGDSAPVPAPTEDLRVAEDRASSLPLPKGEGRAEGEGNTLQPDSVKPDAPVAVVADIPPIPEPQPESKPAKTPKRKKSRRDDQMDFFAAQPPPEAPDALGPTKTESAAPVRRLPPAPPVNPAELRKAVNVILPLLIDQDPGAKDCLKDNRNTFRSAFSPEAYVEFEQLLKTGNFAATLEQLKKAARKHDIPV